MNRKTESALFNGILSKALDKLLNMFVKTKKYHWYAVKYVYRDSATGSIIFNWCTHIGLSVQSDILNRRCVREIVDPLHKRKDVKRSSLRNGYLEYQVQCYLGQFPANKEHV